jgi:hypothetical protein
MKGLTTMYDHRGKIWGIIISAIGLIAMVTERFTKFIVFQKYNSSQHYGIFEWIMLFGLALVMYSKEKHEDERTKAVRLKSFQIAFMIMLGVVLGIALTKTLHPLPIHTEELFFQGAIGIIFYLIFFHVGLYFDFLWEYDDKGLWENWKNIDKNKWGMLAYFVCAAVGLFLLTLL